MKSPFNQIKLGLESCHLLPTIWDVIDCGRNNTSSGDLMDLAVFGQDLARIDQDFIGLG